MTKGEAQHLVQKIVQDEPSMEIIDIRCSSISGAYEVLCKYPPNGCISLYRSQEDWELAVKIARRLQAI